ncbi:MAG: hypothetical protein U5K56_01635 [Halioglobus sp.]|nr:hypothetical protein [Halioglobus sp.]
MGPVQHPAPVAAGAHRGCDSREHGVQPLPQAIAPHSRFLQRHPPALFVGRGCGIGQHFAPGQLFQREVDHGADTALKVIVGAFGYILRGRRLPRGDAHRQVLPREPHQRPGGRGCHLFDRRRIVYGHARFEIRPDGRQQTLGRRRPGPVVLFVPADAGAQVQVADGARRADVHQAGGFQPGFDLAL